MASGSIPVQDDYTYVIKRTTETISIDGVLSENIWDQVPVAANFWMSYPVDDRKVEGARQTEVRLISDDQYLYIGVVCYGPKDYVIKTLKRDTEFWDGDGFGVVVDPVNEKTNGFAFGVNPAGVQTEYLVTGQAGRREDLKPGHQLKGINVAWDNKWYSEVTNHPDKWVAEIAIPFKTLRFDAGKKTWGINFFRLDAGTNSIHTWAPVPIEFREIDLGYTGTLSWESPPQKAKRNIAIIPYAVASGAKEYESDGLVMYDFQPGLDAKIPVTSSLNLDVTVNPDFSQVEVDEQVINLTLFDIRLPEKRLFFLENSDIFEDFGIPPMRPFFSRRIGLDEEGNSIPILYGARLSGNINKDLRVGLMNLQTRETEDFLSQNYTVMSFHQQVLSRSVIKGYIHNRQGINSEVPDYNRNAGLEFQYRSTDGRFQTFAGYAKSFSPGMDSRNYFYNAGIGYDNKNISVYSSLSGLGKNYKADMGFIMGQQYYDAIRDTSIRIGYNHLYSRFAYTLYPESGKKIISHEFGVRHIYDVDTAFSLLSNNVEPSYSIKFSSTSKVQFAFNYSVVSLLFPFTFINEIPLPAGIYKYARGEMRYESDQRRLFSLEGGVSYGTFYNGTRARYTFGIKYRAQPWGNFSVNFEQNDLKFPDPYGTENLFLISPRIEINFSRSLFWTTFLQYNTQDDNFNINSRIQWRFQPLSDLYIVYTDNYAVEFWGPKNRALVIKLNYWFNL
ncbi:MAG: carbohydrate binding family 9 domain-containing protein [Bacteroidales bacterium]|nr:carbohydrate binding family 9 domain-containing protein [Bacteroidales bacterium]